MAEGALVHAADGLLDRLLGIDGHGVRGHHVAQLGRRGLQAGGDDADEEVALGEDAEQAPVLGDEDAAATLLGHALDRVADRLVGVGADEVGAETTAVEDGAYGTLGHVALPDTAVGPLIVRAGSLLITLERPCSVSTGCLADRFQKFYSFRREYIIRLHGAE